MPNDNGVMMPYENSEGQIGIVVEEEEGNIPTAYRRLATMGI